MAQAGSAVATLVRGCAVKTLPFDFVAFWKSILAQRLRDFRNCTDREESGQRWNGIVRARRELYDLGVVPE